LNPEYLTNEEITVIFQENAQLKHQIRRARTQGYLVFAILMSIFSLAIFIVLASAIFDLQESIISMVKEIILIISSNLATAVGVVYGVKEKDYYCDSRL